MKQPSSKVSFDIAMLVAATGLKHFYVCSIGITKNQVQILGCREDEPDLVSFTWAVYGQKTKGRLRPLDDVLVAELKTRVKAERLAALLNGGAPNTKVILAEFFHSRKRDCRTAGKKKSASCIHSF